MASKPKHPPGDPKTLGNMRELGVQRLMASCLNDACRHTALIDVTSYPADTELPWFASKIVCAKCNSRGRHIDVGPNWKEPALRRKPNRQALAISVSVRLAAPLN